MNKFAAALVLVLFCDPFLHGRAASSAHLPDNEKPAPTGFSLPVHVSAAHLRSPCGDTFGPDCLYLDVVIAGKKLELEGNGDSRAGKIVLTPGDYQAKLIKDAEPGSGMIHQQYDLLLRDNSTWTSVVTGISE